MEKPTPRINSGLRQKYIERIVRLTGKVVSFSGESALIESSDGGQILIKTNKEAAWGTSYVEIIGRIEKDFSITEFSSINLGENIGKYG
ncbi:replication factor A protein 3 [Phycomyces nitens]|nr:replication factor A protein 3 [Phycomyces nitens]